MRSVKQVFQESFALIGESYRLAMRNKRLCLVIFGVSLLVGLATTVAIFLASAPLFLVPKGGASIKMYTFVYAVSGYFVAVALAYITYITLFLYATGLKDKKPVAIFTCFDKTFQCLLKPFFLLVIAISFVPLLKFLFIFSYPVIVHGSGNVKRGFSDLLQLWKHFWSRFLAVMFCSFVFFGGSAALLLLLFALAKAVSWVMALFALAVIGLIPGVCLISMMWLFIMVLIYKESLKIKPELYK